MWGEGEQGTLLQANLFSKTQKFACSQKDRNLNSCPEVSCHAYWSFWSPRRLHKWFSIFPAFRLSLSGVHICGFQRHHWFKQLPLSLGVWSVLLRYSSWWCRGSSIHGALGSKVTLTRASECSLPMPLCATLSTRVGAQSQTLVVRRGPAWACIMQHRAAGSQEVAHGKTCPRGEPTSACWLLTMWGKQPQVGWVSVGPAMAPMSHANRGQEAKKKGSPSSCNLF